MYLPTFSFISGISCGKISAFLISSIIRVSLSFGVNAIFLVIGRVSFLRLLVVEGTVVGIVIGTIIGTFVGRLDGEIGDDLARNSKTLVTRCVGNQP